jgi:hypothetical protein
VQDAVDHAREIDLGRGGFFGVETRVVQQILDESIEIPRGRENLLDTFQRARSEPVFVPAIELLRVAGDAAQRRLEVVRHGVAERLQFFVPPPQQLRDALVLAALVFELYVLRLQFGGAALDQRVKEPGDDGRHARLSGVIILIRQSMVGLR